MLLSICIPTYNRHKELAVTVDKLKRVISEIGYCDKVEIIISDNSEGEHLEKNSSFCDLEGVRYSANEKNIGFARNVLRSVSLAQADYFWIVPDNDDFDENGLKSLFKYIDQLDPAVDCVFVPFEYKQLTGEMTIGSSYGGQQYSLIDLLSNGELPFVLLSSAVVKRNLDASSCHELHQIFGDNSFIQIPLIIENIQNDSVCMQFNEIVVIYNVEYDGRFNPAKCHKAILDVIGFISKKYNIDMKKRAKREYHSLLRSLISASTDIYLICEFNDALAYARREALNNLNVKSLLFNLILLFPKKAQSWVYLQYVSLAYSCRVFSSTKKRLGDFKRV